MFTWSFSKLDNFETCAKKYEAYSVSRSVKDDSTENIDWGNEVHDAMAKALKGNALPEHMLPYQPWVDRVLSGPGDRFRALGLSRGPRERLQPAT